MIRGWMDTRELVADKRNTCAPGDRDISASTQMEAEIPRVLHALAVPEYMEAWLQVPDAERIECRSDPRSFDRFRIDLFAERRRRGSIHGSCLLTKPNRITYLWEDSSSESFHSLVEIRLWAYPAQCTLRLRHCGLKTREESERYSCMWRTSLKKLRALMEGTGAGPVRSTTRWLQRPSYLLNQSVPGVR
jgi:uncharacterized protein YndB with AHSA1/START domain